MSVRIFADRSEAGKELGRQLTARDLDDPVVLALPRGGVPVALEVARALAVPLDLVLVRKIGVPDYREVAAAAVVDGGDAEIVYNRDVMHAAGLDEADIQREAEQELREIERPRERLEGRDLIIVDDGIATGATMRAAVKALKRKRAKRLIVAVPVAAPEVVAALRKIVDEVVCLEMPVPFHAVGNHYDDFHQLSDAEVVEALDEAARFGRTSAAER
jgi:putative phosphoribosyl transferase